jgi:AcrR family transcriptional regulator
MGQRNRHREAGGSAARTPGGWVPVGTSAQRRANHDHKREYGEENATRQELVRAARRVFEKKGYHEARVADIVAEAGLAHGSFYTYFSSKREVFEEIRILMGNLVNEAVEPSPARSNGNSVEALAQSNRRYLDMYRENSTMYAILEQTAMSDPDIHEARLAGRRGAVQRVAASIKRWQARGVADPDVDPEIMAAAMLSMLTNTAYWQFAGGDSYDDDQVLKTLNMVWTRAVGLRSEPGPEAGRRVDGNPGS